MPFIQKNVASFLILALLFNGCASFKPEPMPFVNPENYPHKTSKEGIEVRMSQYSGEEIKKYFAADLAKKEVWPFRLSIKNNSSKSYLFTKGYVQPNQIPSHRASREGKRSAGWRFGTGLLFFITFFGIPIAIPLFVGGFQALSANNYMSKSYKEWEIQDVKLDAGKEIDGVVFFQKTTAPREFTISLLEADTNQKLEIPITIT